MASVDDWLKSGAYLPEPLRDFHDQKDIFKTIDERVTVAPENRINWIVAQIYVIDVFLWFMAKRGYTLQRCRAKVEFRSLEDDVRESGEWRRKVNAAALADFMHSRTTNRAIEMGAEAGKDD